jgi:23S rRNA pseudouridine1911/1915/1917 synthase
VHSFTVGSTDENRYFFHHQTWPLLATLLALLPHKNRASIKAVLRDRQVLVDGQAVGQFDHQLRPGQVVAVHWDHAGSSHKAPLGVRIVHEDDDLLIIDKPAGLLTVATDKEKRKTAYAILSAYVKEQDPGNKIFIVHRLDRETSGLLMFAKNEAIKRLVQDSWNDTISRRSYVAVVEGRVAEEQGTITSWLNESKALIVYSSQNPQHGRKAITHYRKLRESAAMTLLQLNLETGRKHQIRVHLQDINHPVVGDSKYGSTINPLRRLALHAQVLAFTHPKTHQDWLFETEIPKNFLNLFR